MASAADERCGLRASDAHERGDLVAGHALAEASRGEIVFAVERLGHAGPHRARVVGRIDREIGLDAEGRLEEGLRMDRDVGNPVALQGRDEIGERLAAGRERRAAGGGD